MKMADLNSMISMLTSRMGIAHLSDDDDDSQGTSVESNVAFDMTFPFIYTFFNGPSERVKQNALKVAQYMSGPSMDLYLHDTAEEFDLPAPEGTRVYRATIEELKIKVIMYESRTEINIYNAHLIIAFINHLLNTYFPEDWADINVLPFFNHLSLMLKKRVHAEVEDI